MVRYPLDDAPPPAAAFSHRSSMPQMIRAQPCGLSLRSCRRNVFPPPEVTSCTFAALLKIKTCPRLLDMLRSPLFTVVPLNEQGCQTTPSGKQGCAKAQRWQVASRIDFFPTRILTKERRPSEARLALSSGCIRREKIDSAACHSEALCSPARPRPYYNEHIKRSPFPIRVDEETGSLVFISVSSIRTVPLRDAGSPDRGSSCC